MSAETFVLLGAGLPRTGTMSTRAALRQLLGGEVYHMMTVAMERPDHHPLWRKALAGTITKGDWEVLLEDYVAGVDYPISLFYKDILKVQPNVKVLLTERDPVRWYESVRDSIMKVNTIQNSWPQSFFSRLLGLYEEGRLPYDISSHSESGNKKGMYGAVQAGQEAAVMFYEDHVREVKRVVPASQLLCFEVKQGWAPLCEFLNVPEPSVPFPRVNDTSTILRVGRIIQIFSWTFVVGLPILLLLTALTMGWNVLTVAGGYAVFMFVLRLFSTQLFSRNLARAFKDKNKNKNV